MRVGIVTHVVNFHRFAKYFDDSEKTELLQLNNNDIGPAPSLIAEGLLQNNCFVRFFTIGPYSRVFKSKSIEIFMAKYEPNALDKRVFGPLRETVLFHKLVKGNFSDLDVLHAHWTYGAANGLYSFTKKIPVFCTVRDWAPVIRAFSPHRGGLLWFVKNALNERILRNPNVHFIANSPYTKNLLDDRLKKEIPCILNPIENSSLINKEKAYPSDLQIVTILSYLSNRKNADKLLEAFKLVHMNLSASNLHLIIGMTEDALNRSEAYKRWMENDLLAGVKIHCNVSHDNIYNYIDQSTLMLHPALEETFGNIIIESIARKTPVIGGESAGAIPYLLQEGKYGYLCDVRSVESMASTVLAVYNDLDKAKRKAEAAYIWLRENDTVGTIGLQHIKCFEKYI